MICRLPPPILAMIGLSFAMCAIAEEPITSQEQLTSEGTRGKTLILGYASLSDDPLLVVNRRKELKKKRRDRIFSFHLKTNKEPTEQRQFLFWVPKDDPGDPRVAKYHESVTELIEKYGLSGHTILIKEGKPFPGPGEEWFIRACHMLPMAFHQDLVREIRSFHDGPICLTGRYWEEGRHLKYFESPGKRLLEERRPALTEQQEQVFLAAQPSRSYLFDTLYPIPQRPEFPIEHGPNALWTWDAPDEPAGVRLHHLTKTEAGLWFNGRSNHNRHAVAALRIGSDGESSIMLPAPTMDLDSFVIAAEVCPSKAALSSDGKRNINVFTAGRGWRWLCVYRNDEGLTVTLNNHRTKFQFPGVFVPGGVWSRVAVSYEGAKGEVSLYVNGVLAGTRSVPKRFYWRVDGAQPYLHLRDKAVYQRDFSNDRNLLGYMGKLEIHSGLHLESTQEALTRVPDFAGRSTEPPESEPPVEGAPQAEGP